MKSCNDFKANDRIETAVNKKDKYPSSKMLFWDSREHSDFTGLVLDQGILCV